jgi:hypothetical protein
MYPGERDICSAHLTVASAQHIRDLHAALLRIICSAHLTAA